MQLKDYLKECIHSSVTPLLILYEKGNRNGLLFKWTYTTLTKILVLKWIFFALEKDQLQDYHSPKQYFLILPQNPWD